MLVATSLSDFVHHDDDTITARIRIGAPASVTGKGDLLVDANVTSQFWEAIEVTDYDCLTVHIDRQDVDALVIAVFRALGHSIRECGVDSASCVHLNFREFLSERLPPAIASRLDQTLAPRLSRAGNTVSFNMNF